jgi:hypothetical protein
MLEPAVSSEVLAGDVLVLSGRADLIGIIEREWLTAGA